MTCLWLCLSLTPDTHLTPPFSPLVETTASPPLAHISCTSDEEFERIANALAVGEYLMPKGNYGFSK